MDENALKNAVFFKPVCHRMSHYLVFEANGEIIFYIRKFFCYCPHAYDAVIRFCIGPGMLLAGL